MGATKGVVLDNESNAAAAAPAPGVVAGGDDSNLANATDEDGNFAQGVPTLYLALPFRRLPWQCSQRLMVLLTLTFAFVLR